jgi:hypothetical protein
LATNFLRIFFLKIWPKIICPIKFQNKIKMHKKWFFFIRVGLIIDKATLQENLIRRNVTRGPFPRKHIFPKTFFPEPHTSVLHFLVSQFPVSHFSVSHFSELHLWLGEMCFGESVHFTLPEKMPVDLWLD